MQHTVSYSFPDLLYTLWGKSSLIGLIMHLFETCRCWEIFRIVESCLSLQIYLNLCSIFHTSKELLCPSLKPAFCMYFQCILFSILVSCIILNSNLSNNNNNNKRAADHTTFFSSRISRSAHLIWFSANCYRTYCTADFTLKIFCYHHFQFPLPKKYFPIAWDT
jgi:hypothetical protein